MGLLNEICKANGIRLGRYSDNATVIESSGLAHLTHYRGFSAIPTNGQPIIYYDDGAPADGIPFTVAHEIGHILMGHLSNRSRKPEEIEADIFAAVLTALVTYDKVRSKPSAA